MLDNERADPSNDMFMIMVNTLQKRMYLYVGLICSGVKRRGVQAAPGETVTKGGEGDTKTKNMTVCAKRFSARQRNLFVKISLLTSSYNHKIIFYSLHNHYLIIMT